MKGSLKIGTWFGIGVYLHFTFLLFVGLYGWSQYAHTGSVAATLNVILFIAALFLCLLMHEFGHALTARRFGIATRDITLLPIGGVARLEKMPEKPWQEFLVAVMGPMVNIVIATAIGAGLVVTYGAAGTRELLFPLTALEDSFWVDLAKINILLVLFNMLPAFPMDGGRVVRSLLALALPYERATRIAEILGKAMALAFVLEVFGLNVIPWFDGSNNFMLLFIAAFVWMGAGSESRFVQMKAGMGQRTVGSVMVSNFRTLSPRDTIEWAAELAASGLQQDFPVAEDGKVVGVLYRAQLQAALQRNEPYMMVRDVMRTDIVTATTTDLLSERFADLLTAGHGLVPVTSRGLLVGLLPLERLVHLPSSPGMRGPNAAYREEPRG